MIKGAIFDLDGTILDSMKVWDDLADKYLLSIGVEPPKGLKETFALMSLRQSARWIIDNLYVQKTEEEIMKGYDNELNNYYKNHVELKPGFLDFFKGLRSRGVPCCIVTTNSRINTECALRKFGLQDDFKFILTCSEEDTDKTKPYIYLKAAKMLKIKPLEVVVFEDSYHSLKTAKDAKFRVYSVFDESNIELLEESKEVSDYFTIDYKNLEEVY